MVYCDYCRKRDGSCTQGHERSAELIIGKQRNGAIGSINLAFFGEHTRFENLSERGD
jgi:replicative DNA helicase